MFLVIVKPPRDGLSLVVSVIKVWPADPTSELSEYWKSLVCTSFLDVDGTSRECQVMVDSVSDSFSRGIQKQESTSNS